jgi:pyruvate dehydrogenase E1 component
MGALMPEVLEAAACLESEQGLVVGVVCLTSADLVFRSMQQRGSLRAPAGSGVLDLLFPVDHPTPLVTVLDGHPHTLAFLAGARGDRIRCLGVTDFGSSTDLPDAYRLHGLDVASIVGAGLDLLGR